MQKNNTVRGLLVPSPSELSNKGRGEYTVVYRIDVHGKSVKDALGNALSILLSDLPNVGLFDVIDHKGVCHLFDIGRNKVIDKTTLPE